MDKLEKIDLIKERFNVSYEEADIALEESDGDLVSALISLENQKQEKDREDKTEYKVKGQELIEKIKELIKKGNIKKITVRNEQGETVLEIPVTAGVVGLVLFPYIGILAGLAAMLKEYKLEIDKKDE
ncbi:MAG: DUF4342 domain-containing protein [Halanaerobiales bacterium]